MSTGKIKIVISGDAGTGKSNLVNVYRGEEYNSIPVSDVQDIYVKNVCYNGQDYELEIVDTIDNDIYSYSDINLLFQECDCVIFTYAIDDIQSFNNLILRYSKLPITLEAHEKWTIINDQIKKFPPIILVGTKSDLQLDRQVSIQDANKMYNDLALNGLFECSSILGSGVKEIFEKGIELGLNHQTGDNEYKYIEEGIRVMPTEMTAPIKKSEIKKDLKTPKTPKTPKRHSNEGCCILM